MLKRVALVAVVLGILSAVVTAAQEEKQRVTGTALLGFVGYVTPPQVTQHDGQTMTRGAVQTWELGPGTDPDLVSWLDGEITFVVNCNFNAESRGPCWGTFEWSVPDIGGVWIGSVTSPLMDLTTYESRFSMVGRGVGGAIDGKQLRFDGGSAPGDWYITGVVRIQ